MLKKKKKENEQINIKRGFEPETIINSKFWSIINIMRDLKEEKDKEGNIIRSARQETKLVEFFDNASRNRYIEQLKEDVGEEAISIEADNNTGWVVNKLFDDVDYLQKRVLREEVRRREE